jgi:vacuolar-type H+-ATPase subunit I/STV1
MILPIFGAALLIMGLFAGGVLVLAPVGLVPWSPEVVLWVIFPLFSVIGYALFVVGARAQQIQWLSLVASWSLLALALVSAAALVCVATAMVRPVGSTVSLWYVFVVAGLIGAIGAAARGTAAVSGNAGA